jgi:IstB-like ATP binding protein
MMGETIEQRAGETLALENACPFLEWNIIALGNSGTGKTHACLALGLADCQRGFTVSFTTAVELVHQLMEARDEKRLLKLQAQLAAVKLLIIDELGYVPLSQTGVDPGAAADGSLSRADCHCLGNGRHSSWSDQLRRGQATRHRQSRTPADKFCLLHFPAKIFLSLTVGGRVNDGFSLCVAGVIPA